MSGPVDSGAVSASVVVLGLGRAGPGVGLPLTGTLTHTPGGGEWKCFLLLWREVNEEVEQHVLGSNGVTQLSTGYFICKFILKSP